MSLYFRDTIQNAWCCCFPWQVLNYSKWAGGINISIAVSNMKNNCWKIHNWLERILIDQFKQFYFFAVAVVQEAVPFGGCFSTPPTNHNVRQWRSGVVTMSPAIGHGQLYMSVSMVGKPQPHHHHQYAKYRPAGQLNYKCGDRSYGGLCSWSHQKFTPVVQDAPTVSAPEFEDINAIDYNNNIEYKLDE